METERSSGKYPRVLGVRLPPGAAEELARKAEADDRSPSGYARKVILDALQRTDDPTTGARGA
jgi:hypothetical protein